VAIKAGDKVQGKRDLSCGALGLNRVGKGKQGVVFKVSMFGKYSVRFDNGIRCEGLTDEDIKTKTWWS
jgi:hypothetical protein